MTGTDKSVCSKRVAGRVDVATRHTAQRDALTFECRRIRIGTPAWITDIDLWAAAPPNASGPPIEAFRSMPGVSDLSRQCQESAPRPGRIAGHPGSVTNRAWNRSPATRRMLWRAGPAAVRTAVQPRINDRTSSRADEPRCTRATVQD